MAIAENNKEILFMPQVENSHHWQILIYFFIWFLMGKHLIAFVLEIKLIELWIFPVAQKVISQAALFYKLLCGVFLIYLLSADKCSALIYVGKDRLSLLICIRLYRYVEHDLTSQPRRGTDSKPSTERPKIGEIQRSPYLDQIFTKSRWILSSFKELIFSIRMVF